MPVTIIEFSDYQPSAANCIWRGRQIDENYVDAGKVKFVYWQFAFLGDESKWAAEASECANDQGKFWEYHDYLFDHQGGENQGAFSKENLKDFAATLELDTQAFNECMDSGKYTDIVAQDTSIAQALEFAHRHLLSMVSHRWNQPYESFGKR
jgi:protein-disulfide isomerase